MPSQKATDRFIDSHSPFFSVTVPKSRELATLLRVSDGPADIKRLFGGLATAADPNSGHNGAVSLPMKRVIAERLAVLLGRARQENHPAADLLAGVARQVGIPDPGPAPATTAGQVS